MLLNLLKIIIILLKIGFSSNIVFLSSSYEDALGYGNYIIKLNKSKVDSMNLLELQNPTYDDINNNNSNKTYDGIKYYYDNHLTQYEIYNIDLLNQYIIKGE